MKKNKVRELLDAGKPTIGTHMVTTSPQIVEIIGYSGAFDYIELVGEYASWGLADLENFARSVELFPHMSSMMKVDQEPRIFITTRSLGCGIQNILFSDIHSAAEVKECIRAVRPETPEDGGVHGCSMRRNVGYLLECGNEAWAKAQRDVVIAIMIEKASAMEHLDEILSVKGVDMVQFGPCDYSISIGKLGQAQSPEIEKVQRDMIELALKKGVQPRVEIGSFEQAKEYIDMGVRHFCIGTDLVTIYQWCQQNGEGMRKLLGR
ncbi:4-hydroxy-2-oxo-heptane-1,7-dioate aldolase [subsurface metagenome]